jgi:DNA-binding transcriptional ArsR family regulator
MQLRTQSCVLQSSHVCVKKYDLTMGKSVKLAYSGNPQVAPTGSEVTSVPPIDSLLRQELDELVASMCKALNDPKRLLLLYALRNGRYTVSELCELIEAPQSNTSQHLAVLRDRGLVEAERQGNNVVYSLRHPKVIDAIDILRGVMSDELERQTALRAPGR